MKKSVFSWFLDWIPKVRRKDAHVNLIDLVNEYLSENSGFDTAENESLKFAKR